MSIDTPCEVLGLKDSLIDIFIVSFILIVVSAIKIFSCTLCVDAYLPVANIENKNVY